MKIRLAVFLPSLARGGAEKATLNLLASLNDDQYEKTLILMRHPEPRHLPAPQGVDVVVLAASRHRWSPLPLARLIRSREFDLLLSVTDGAIISAGIAAKLVTRRCRPVMLGALHTMLSRRRLPLHVRAVLPLLIRVLYPGYRRLVAVSNGVKEDYLHRYRFLSQRLVTIPNVAYLESEISRHRQPMRGRSEPPDLVACGRLIPEKGFDVLIQAIAIVRQTVDARLTVVGGGPERDRLDRLARALGQSDVVQFVGEQEDPLRWIARSDLFVHSSREDALPTTLIEAMALGIPFVATACSPGVLEIVGSRLQTRLVSPPGSAQALSAKIISAIVSLDEQDCQARVGAQEALRFSASRVVGRYESLFLESIDRHR